MTSKSIQQAEVRAAADAEYRRKKEAAREAKRIAEAEEAQRVEEEMMALLSGSSDAATSPTGDSSQQQRSVSQGKRVGDHAPPAAVVTDGVAARDPDDATGSHDKPKSDEGSTAALGS